MQGLILHSAGFVMFKVFIRIVNCNDAFGSNQVNLWSYQLTRTYRACQEYYAI